MPLLTELSSPTDWTDPDLVPRPVVTYGAAGIVMAKLDPDRQEMDFHRHRKNQLVLLLRGVLTCEVECGLWIVPPQSAIWVPGGVLHKITTAGTIECYVSFIDPSLASNLPANCCAVSTTPLLRELLIRSASFPVLYSEGGMESHLATLLLDEIALAGTQRAEVLLNYGNWSKKGSTHIDDQLPLASKKQMRPMWRDRKDIEANLESRKVF